MAVEDPPKPERQITYQIGWKKGKIDYSKRKGKIDNSKKNGKTGSDPLPASTEQKQESIEKKKVQAASIEKGWTSSNEMSFSSVCGMIWLVSFPFAVGGLFIWLVFRLLNFNYGGWA